MKPEEMLAWYSARLPTVEINNTFYQMPKTAVLENWAKTTPEDFRFAIKASRRITHMSRLRAETAADSVNFLYTTLAALGAKRGAVLFQLPPFLKKDLPRLSEFLTLLPEGHGAAFEFRNDSWFDDDVYDALKAAGASLCFSSAKTMHRRLWWKQRPGAMFVFGLKPTPTTTYSSGRQSSKLRRGARSTCTSCTSRLHPRMRKR